MLNFKFKKIVFNFFLIFFTSFLFSENNSFLIDQSVFLDGNIFVKEKTNIKNNLEVEGIRVLYNNFDINNNLEVNGNVIAENFLVTGTLSFSIFQNTGLDYVCKVINIGDYTNNDKKTINIGSTDSGKTTVDSGDVLNGVSVGTETLNVFIGDDELTGNINISAENININSKAIKYLISDFGDLPILENTNLIRIDKDKYLSSADLSINTSTDAEFEKLHSSGNIKLSGDFIVNNGEGSNVWIETSGAGEVFIGEDNSEIELLGQWDIIGESIKIENPESIVSIGSAGNILRLSQLSTSGNLYLSENDNIIFPFEDEVSVLKIYGDGSITTGTGQLNDNINFINLTVTDKADINGNVILNGGDVEYTTNIGSVEAGEINLISNDKIKINSNSDLNLKGKNLNLNLNSQTFPDIEKKGHLLINLNGDINILNSGFSNNLNIGTLTCNGQFNLLKGICIINNSGSSDINISSDSNSGLINIGNSSVNSLNLNSGENIEIGLNSETVNIGNSNIKEIKLLTTLDSGLISLNGQKLQLKNDLELEKFLSIDSNGVLKYEHPSYLDNNGNKSIYLSNVNLENVYLNGNVHIGDGSSLVQIEGNNLKIGDKQKSDLTFNKNIQIISKYLEIGADSQIHIGKNVGEGSNVVNISSMKASNNLGFYINDLQDLVLSLKNNEYLILLINSNKEVKVSKFFEEENVGNINFNKESFYDIQLGNFNDGGAVIIKTSSGLIIENTNNSDILIKPNGSFIISSEDITLPEGNPVQLYINQDDKFITTTSNLIRNKNDAKIKDLKISQKNLIKLLKPKSFFYNDKKHGINQEYGLIAEDLEGTVLDPAVIYSSNKSILGIDYEKIFNLISNDYKIFYKNMVDLKEKNENLKEKCFFLINNVEKIKVKK